MNKNIKNHSNLRVINKGKIPENITSKGKNDLKGRSFKVTPSQNEQIETDIRRGGFNSFTEYVQHMLFDRNPIITIEGGRDILIKLSECADLLNAMGDNAAYNSNEDFEKLIDKFSEIELSISQIFDYIDIIKRERISEKEGE